MEIGIDSFAKKTQTNEGGTVRDDAKSEDGPWDCTRDVIRDPRFVV